MSFPSVAELFSILYITEDSSGFTAINVQGNEAVPISSSATLIFTRNPTVPDDIQYLTLTGSSIELTEEAVFVLQHRLPVDTKIIVRKVVDPTHDTRVVLTTLYLAGQEPQISTLTIGVEEINETIIYNDNVRVTLQISLLEIILRPPASLHSIQYSITATVEFLSSLNNLVVAILTFNAVRDIEQILTALQGHQHLTHLAILLAPASPIQFLVGEGRTRLNNALSRGLEGLVHLKRLVIEPEFYDTSIQVRTTIERMVNLQGLPDTTLPSSEDREARTERRRFRAISAQLSKKSWSIFASCWLLFMLSPFDRHP